jgi:hypothetical protein
LAYSLTFELLSVEPFVELDFIEGEKRFIISYSIMTVLIILRIISLIFKGAHKNKEKILNSTFPALYSALAFSLSNADSFPEKS